MQAGRNMEMIVYFCQELGAIGLWGPEILEWHMRAGTLGRRNTMEKL